MARGAEWTLQASGLRQVEHVLPGAAAYVQHRALDLARLFQPNKFCLGTANIPWRSAPAGGIEARLDRVTVRIGHTARQRYTCEPWSRSVRADGAGVFGQMWLATRNDRASRHPLACSTTS